MGSTAETSWEIAEKEAEGSRAIFEATPERFAVNWNILSAKPGDLIPADVQVSESFRDNWPQMLITLRVKRVYKGDIGPEVQVHTGMGSGDCGAQYRTGLDYLVYASGPSPIVGEPDGQFDGSETVDFRGSFPLPRVKYFSFGKVLPGRYRAYACASGRGWLTRVVDVNVTSHAKLIFLELQHAKGGDIKPAS